MNIVAFSDQDLDVVVRWNRELQEDEGALVMGIEAIEKRLRKWLVSGYEAVIFRDTQPLGYALYRKSFTDSEGEGIYLRQFFIDRALRRRGLGRDAFNVLAKEKFSGSRLILEALVSNPAGTKFWHAVGLLPYSTKFEAQL